VTESGGDASQVPAAGTYEFAYVVTDADTAEALGSGDVAVLGTPRVLALVESATVALLRERLPADRTSVGVDVALRHRAPSLVGETVLVRAEQQSGDDRRVTFEVEVRDPDGRVLADGIVTRAVAERSRFAG
jgi:fluoroacetyl-CoA thioesterase